jgi:hypothetical protein
MDLAKVLYQLRQDLVNIDAAILSLERLQHTGRRRGRPPGALARALESASGAETAEGSLQHNSSKPRARRPKDSLDHQV